MIPQGELTPQMSSQKQVMTSRTYRWNKETNRIEGFIDGSEAIEQAIDKILSTNRYENLIYSFFYGIEVDDLVGQDKILVNADIKRRIEEALLQDNRIDRLDNFKVSSGSEKDQLIVTFDAITINGTINVTREVMV